MYRPPEASPMVTLDVVDRWLIRAAEALMSNWDESAGNFWRDSWETRSDTSESERGRSRAIGPGKGSTSNNRSFQALVTGAYFLSENEDLAPDSPVRSFFPAAVHRMAADYFTLPLDKLRDHGENGMNPYTDAHLLMSLALALSPVTESVVGVRLDARRRQILTDHLRVLSKEVVNEIGPDGVRVHENARAHQFLTMHTVRAIDTAKSIAEGDSRLRSPSRLSIESNKFYGPLMESVRAEIVQQLGLHLLPAPGFDSSSLISSCALLSRFSGDADSPLVQQAVTALVEDQSERGMWTTSGVLSFGRRRLVYIPSIELSLTLATLARRDLSEQDTDIFLRALPALDASLRLVQSSFSRHGDKTGWRNDRTQSGFEVESWITAVVLQFLISYREALAAARQEDILRKYRADRPAAQFSSAWADLAMLAPSSERQNVLAHGKLTRDRLGRFDDLVDPTDDNSIVTGVHEEILEPTLKSTHLRPVETASFLLYGPPGTRKTTFVERLSEELNWPLVTLSPPVFLRNGIEGFEASADEIFEDLMHLKRVVVLFDECEEFFRWRPLGTSIESRTIGAFITSGMLPRLQGLRKERWIVFVINTNVEAFELDDAVTRRGRLDKVARVGHPVLAAQLRYLDAWRSRKSGRALLPRHLSWFADHLGKVEEEMEPFRSRFAEERKQAQIANPDRGQSYRSKMAEIETDAAHKLTKVVTFTSLDNLASRCLGEGTTDKISSSRSLAKNLQDEFDRFGPDSFAPSAAWYNKRT